MERERTTKKMTCLAWSIAGVCALIALFVLVTKACATDDEFNPMWFATPNAFKPYEPYSPMWGAPVPPRWPEREPSMADLIEERRAQEQRRQQADQAYQDGYAAGQRSRPDPDPHPFRWKDDR